MLRHDTKTQVVKCTVRSRTRRCGFASVLVVVVWLVSLSASCAREADLHQAVVAHDRERIQSLLDGGAEINSETRDGFTALALAARHGDEDIVELLLANGALPEHGGDPHKYPRAQAEVGGHKAIFDRLLFHEAIAGPEPMRARRAGPPDDNDTYVRRVLVSLGHAEAGSGDDAPSPQAIRAFQKSEKMQATGEISRETLFNLWIMDPITRRDANVPYAAGECHVCVSRLWNTARARGIIVSAGGCMNSPEFDVQHVIDLQKSRSEIPPNGIVEVVTRYGDGCRAAK